MLLLHLPLLLLFRGQYQIFSLNQLLSHIHPNLSGDLKKNVAFSIIQGFWIKITESTLFQWLLNFPVLGSCYTFKKFLRSLNCLGHQRTFAGGYYIYWSCIMNENWAIFKIFNSFKNNPIINPLHVNITFFVCAK